MNNKPSNKKNCSACGGTKLITCPKCKGAGKIKTRYYDLTTAGDDEVLEPCMLCGGAGKIDCPNCQA